MIDRRPFVQKILKDRNDNLRVVSGIGTSTWDLMSAGDNVGNFGFIGAMGQAIPFALGLAKAQPEMRVLIRFEVSKRMKMRTTRLLLCLAARSHMTPQLMTAFPPSETPSAYSWALASLRGPSGNVLHPPKKLHLYIDV